MSRASHALPLSVAAVCAAGALGHAQAPAARSPSARPAPPSRDIGDAAAPAVSRGLLPEAVRSIRVLRSGEVLHAGPDDTTERRGLAARDQRLPALEAVLGPGCATHWVRVAANAWLCQDETELSAEAPDAREQPAVLAGESLPYHYGFAASAGVPAYRRLEDVESDERAAELERGMSVAVDGSARWGGRSFVHTAGGRWVALGDLAWARPSEREGVAYEPGEAVDGVAFARRRAYAWASAEGAAGSARERPQGFLDARAWVHVRERRRVGRAEVARTDAGWVRADALRGPDGTVAPLADAGERERWVDVDAERQVLVAYEGARPVHAALVSTGRAGHATHAGTFRVWVKLATADMSNADDESVDSARGVYGVERVPWVMYFHGDEALHAAYWHDAFGAPHSHGCVNLAPRDARWLFAWAPPAMPAGWEAVFPTAQEPGMRVRVRTARSRTR